MVTKEIWRVFFVLTLLATGNVHAITVNSATTSAGIWTFGIAANLSLCGNKIKDRGEQCDDGNKTNGDGCDGNCTLTRCGNGIKTNGETCDDGNTTNGDGCDRNCTLTRCGNGIISSGEECDDGNNANEDGCNAACLTECFVTFDGSDTCFSGEESFASRCVDYWCQNVCQPYAAYKGEGNLWDSCVVDGDCTAAGVHCDNDEKELNVSTCQCVPDFGGPRESCSDENDCHEELNCVDGQCG